MRALSVALVILMLSAALPASAAPVTPSGPYLPHAPIAILSNANFTVANGVVSGTGTIANPFIIEGWHIFAGSGTGIRIQNVTKSFIIRENLVTAYTGIVIQESAGVSVVAHNEIHTRYLAMNIRNADPLVTENVLNLDVGNASTAAGIRLFASNAHIETNYIRTFGVGIEADQASPFVYGNDIHGATTAIDIAFTSNATIEANIITTPHVGGIRLTSDVGASVTQNNVTTSWGIGIDIWANKDAIVTDNTVTYSAKAGISFETTSGNVTGNIVANGKVDAVLIWHSPLLIVNNTIANNLGIGLHFSMSEAYAGANIISRNGVGISLASSDVIILEANVLANNTVGLNIPYASRQTIVYMQANLVNGINVDGSLVASEQVYFYKAANVTISGQNRDSGFSSGYYGSLTAQGGVVLYEVDTAYINATSISHHNIGVGLVNSFNVNVNGSLLVNNRIGVMAEGITVAFQVPACVVTVKNSNVTIEVDPPSTYGVDIHGCAGYVQNTTISIVDVGIHFDARATGSIQNTTITQTALGIDLQARGLVNVSGNLVAQNREGARISAVSGVLVANRFLDNNQFGIRLDLGSDLRLLGNNVSGNGLGIIDARPCSGPGTCSRVDGEQNVFYGNRGDGVRLNGTSSFRGDVFAGNRGDGARLASATLVNVRSSNNEADGVLVTGFFTVRDSIFERNGANGFRLVGEGSLRNASFTHNVGAGIHATATSVTAFELNVSNNFDGILFEELVPRIAAPTTISAPAILSTVATAALSPDPLDVHVSTFLNNRRDAIRASGAFVNATHNYFGALGPRISALDTVGAFQNGVSPTVRFAPWFTDPEMTTTGPAPFL